MAPVTVSGSRSASAPRRLRSLGRRARGVLRRGQGLRRTARRVLRTAAVPLRLAPLKRPFASAATDALEREERGARAAAEFLRRAAATRELRAAAVAARALRRVKFIEEPPAVLEVVPYSEVYGLHPREFVFGRHYSMVPAQGQFGFNGFDFVADDVDDEEDDNCESDDEFDEFDDIFF